MNPATITSSEYTQFYPTPPELARRMLKDVDWNAVTEILEPSAGKGNLIEAIGEFVFGEQDLDTGTDAGRYRYRRNWKISVDCVEIDPYLRSILKYQFGEERMRAEYENCPRWDNGNLKEQTALYRLLDNTTVHIVHDDFLTFKPYKWYDLIVMNPPFANGEKHLLHALNIQRNGGGVVCLLNAETLRNPFSKSRRELMKRLGELGAVIEYVGDAFADAERRADVDVAVVKVHIPVPERHSTIFERLEKAAEAEDFHSDVTDLVVSDYLEAAVRRFNVECRAGIELIHEWRAMSPYIMRDIEEKPYNRPILKLTTDSSNRSDEISVNFYLQLVRLKYWRALFTNESFMRKMTIKLRNEYLATVDKMQDYDFTLFNIQSVMSEMNAQMVTGVQAEILKIFDKLTSEHSWYSECKQNIHYYSGWKTNKAHKIGRKSVVPEYLQASSYSSDKFDVHKAYGVLSDIEKVFDYLSGNMSRKPMKLDIDNALRSANKQGQTQNINCTYFTVTIYKKGTVHIRYTCPELVDRLNIYAALNRNWLPPNYGKVRYEDLEHEEQAVVNDFHRDEKETEIDPKKSMERYAAVMANPQFYIAGPVQKMLILNGSI